jgi:hypothetical protein
MKKIILLAFLVLAIIGADAQDSKKQTRKEKRAAKEAKKIKQTKSLLESKDYVFSATQALPSGMRSVNLDGSYDIKIEDDEVICYLPFYGRAYSASYGSGEGPFDFTLPVENYTLENEEKGGYLVKFNVHNKNDNINFIINIGNTGSASLIVTSTNRQSINFYGDIEADEDEE